MMLMEAIKASLQEAAKKGLVDATPQPSQELPTLPSQDGEKSPGTCCFLMAGLVYNPQKPTCSIASVPI